MTPDTARWYAYLVTCSDGTLYAGIAKQPDKRVEEHNSSRGGAKYTRGRQPVRLVYLEELPSRSEAARREHEIKRLSRREKLRLVEEWKRRGARDA